MNCWLSAYRKVTLKDGSAFSGLLGVYELRPVVIRHTVAVRIRSFLSSAARMKAAFGVVDTSTARGVYSLNQYVIQG